MARIAVGGFHHETNCFVDGVTDYDYFAAHRDRAPLVRGADVFKWLRGPSYALAGFLEAMEAQHEILPLLWTSGGAGSLVTRAAFERIAGELVGLLSMAMPVDAVYLDLHGAMVTADFDDAEGELLRRVRAAVGEAVPIVVSLDYHANVSPQMVDCSDGMVGYRTYPHVDRQITGHYAARVTQAVIERGRPKGRALRKVPFLIPLNGQCTLVNPTKDIVESSLVLEGDVVNLSYLAGFPPSDLFYCGPSVVAHAWTQEAADAAADRLAADIERKEADFVEEMMSAEDAVARARALAATARRPVVLADTQDNPGVGSSSDTTGLLAALVNGNAEGAVLGYLCDPEAAQMATEAGEGRQVTLALGGKSGPAGVVPFEATFDVVRLATGKLTTTGKVSGGRDIDLGPMAVLRVGGVSVVVTSKRMQAHDAAPFLHMGVDPARQKILALKSTCHFRAEFEPISHAVITVIAPGHFLADPAGYAFRRLRPGVRLRPLGPVSKGPHDPREGVK